jgi:hypothetical protein
VVILLFGPPGSGKGIQSRLHSRRLGIRAISTGDMLRGECRVGTALGKTVETILSSGGWFPTNSLTRSFGDRLEPPLEQRRTNGGTGGIWQLVAEVCGRPKNSSFWDCPYRKSHLAPNRPGTCWTCRRELGTHPDHDWPGLSSRLIAVRKLRSCPRGRNVDEGCFASLGGAPLVPVMKSADLRYRNNGPAFR